MIPSYQVHSKSACKCQGVNLITYFKKDGHRTLKSGELGQDSRLNKVHSETPMNVKGVDPVTNFETDGHSGEILWAGGDPGHNIVLTNSDSTS